MNATSDFTTKEKTMLHIKPRCDHCTNIRYGFIESKEPYFKVYLCKKCMKMVADGELTEDDLLMIYRTKQMGK